MKVSEIELLFEYDNWADARILAACGKVSPEQYAAQANSGTGYESLRATMVHLLDNVWQWRITLQGFYKEPLADEAAYDATELHEDAFPTFAALQERWITEHQKMRDYIATLDEGTLNSTISYVIPGAEPEHAVWEILMEVIIHATQHRSEAAALLTRYGQSPGNYDFSMFLSRRDVETS